MRNVFENKEHLVRLAGLVLAGVVVFLFLQQLLVPKGFGVYGHFRAGALDEVAARPPAHAGRQACEACHSEVAEALRPGQHARVGCEACHGPLATHAGGEESAKPARPEGRAVCLRCHTANVAKPEGFPQVEPKEHAGDALCTECHTAHNPGAAPEATK